MTIACLLLLVHKSLTKVLKHKSCYMLFFCEVQYIIKNISKDIRVQLKLNLTVLSKYKYRIQYGMVYKQVAPYFHDLFSTIR